MHENVRCCTPKCALGASLTFENSFVLIVTVISCEEVRAPDLRNANVDESDQSVSGLRRCIATVQECRKRITRNV